MKRIVVLCIALLLVGCSGTKAAAPQVQQDPRATAKTVTEAPPAPVETPVPATEAPPATEGPAAPADVPAEEGFADRLAAAWQAKDLVEGMFPLTPEDALDYYGIDLAACRSGIIFGDAVGYANEAVIVEADQAVLDEVEGLLREHLDRMKDQYRDYDAEALALAEKAVLLREGNVVLFIISPNAEAMLTAYRDLAA